MGHALASILVVLSTLLSQARSGADVRHLVISGPQTTRKLDNNGLRGIPTRLCPSPDGTQVYLRMSELDRWANETIHHHLLTIRGDSLVRLEGEPTWAFNYWMWKSAPGAPGHPAFRIGLEAREELIHSTNVPREGNIGQHTADPNESLDEVVRRAAQASQKTHVETLFLHGRVISRVVNQHVVPGRTFGWAPAPLGLIAYVNDKGRLVLMDAAGRTREISGARDVTLPAWTDDGRRLLFLERAGKRFELRQVDVR
jgi:hypothetical protein